MKFSLVFFENFIIIKSMIADENNYAYIDNRNIYLGVRNLGWKLDFAKFRRYLLEKYSVKKAYMFIGYVEEHKDIYEDFIEQGYECIFKKTILSNNEIKGNVDAELVLKCALDIDIFNKAVIASGDGDFHCLVEHLISQNKLTKIIIPSRFKYSKVLKSIDPSDSLYFDFLNDKQNILEYVSKNKSPDSGRNPSGTFLP